LTTLSIGSLLVERDMFDAPEDVASAAAAAKHQAKMTSSGLYVQGVEMTRALLCAAAPVAAARRAHLKL